VAEITTLLETRTITRRIDRVFPFSAVPEALRDMAARRAGGTLVIAV
jgi:NADPH:quinone reductase-like Zn-dependent oxidoreductase